MFPPLQEAILRKLTSDGITDTQKFIYRWCPPKKLLYEVIKTNTTFRHDTSDEFESIVLPYACTVLAMSRITRLPLVLLEGTQRRVEHRQVLDISQF